MLYVAAVFLPLIGAIIAGLFGRAVGDRGAQLVTSGCLVVSALLGMYILYDVGFAGNDARVVLATWIDSGALEVDWALRIDTLSAVMIFVVTSVSTLVHIYSIGYMSHDKSIPRFMAYLSLFTFAMLMLVTADNFLQMFFGWEGVGVCSYLLIGFWFDRESANAASIKAFLVNRVGDFGLVLGICAVFVLFGSIEFDRVFDGAAGQADATFTFLMFEGHALTITCLLLFIGAMGKSAQLLLHTWLPDAMEGPTPVSALIHAATMVTAGVFMLARLSPVFEYAPTALIVVCIIGAITAIFAATVGLTQFDIKRVIAYSTCSQLGYMFFACGVSGYAAAIFHLMTHAFFKALLFLGAGSVIHALSDEQDMRRMGGVWRHIKVTYAMMWIGSLALAGVGIPILFVGFAGFYSKDLIIEAAYADATSFGMFAFWMGILAAFLTAFYSWRLLFMTFHGAPRADEKVMAHVHESPQVMLIPLYLLGFGALFAGALGYWAFVGKGMDGFWRESIFVLPQNNVIEAAHDVPKWVKIAPVVVTVLGIALAYLMYIVRVDLPGKVASLFRPIHAFFYNKWYFDELYNFLFVKSSFLFGKGLWKGGDQAVIDGLGPDGVAAMTRRFSRGAGRLQSGYLYHYAFAMMIGVVALVSWYMFTRAG